MKQRVITAYRDKVTNTLFRYDNHAVIIDPTYEPFLVTQNDLFTIPVPELERTIAEFKVGQLFVTIKRVFLLGVILLALIAAAIYFFTLAGYISLNNNILVLQRELMFFAAIAILMLWHDLSTNFDSVQKMPRFGDIDDFMIESVEKGTIQLALLKQRNPLLYLHPMTKQILFSAVIPYRDTYILASETLLKFVVHHEHVQRVLKRLEIENSTEILINVPISSTSAPEFPAEALQSLILYTVEQAIETKSHTIYPEHILLALFEIFPILKNVLKQYHVDVQTFQKAIEWYIIDEQYRAKTNSMDPMVSYNLKGGIADSWVKGFTFFLDKISFNVTDFINKRGGLYGIGHSKEINYLIGILQKKYDANTILVGDPGTGKSSIIYGLAQKILEGDVPSSLRNMNIKTVDINRLLSVAAQEGGISTLVDKLSEELKKQVGTILYFDELMVLLNTGVGSEKTISYLMPLLLQSPIPIIGTMTYAEYALLEKQYPSLLQSFTVIRVDEVDPSDTFTILTTKIRDLEQKQGLYITFPALKDIIDLSQIYMPQKRFPKKAVEILDQAIILAIRMHEKRLTRDIVKNTISEMTKMPFASSSQAAAQKILTLEQKIHERYINQEEGVHAIVEALQRSQTMLRNTSRAIATFLFLGPTGVGKTELAKITAKEYFGSDFSVIRVDLSQFKTANDIPSIIEILYQINLKPYSLVLLDEFEKAPQPILDLFLRLFDEGVLVSPNGENIYFNNSIIICTSNIGSDLLLNVDPVEFEDARRKVLEMIPSYFRPELINRFDRTIIFRPLDQDHIKKIAALNLNELIQKLAMQGITIEYSDITINYLSEEGFNPGMGARPLKRLIQDKIEAPIAKMILTSQTKNEQISSINLDMLIDSAPFQGHNL